MRGVFDAEGWDTEGDWKAACWAASEGNGWVVFPLGRRDGLLEEWGELLGFD